jgi:YVTN family beta-propeller protein
MLNRKRESVLQKLLRFIPKLKPNSKRLWVGLFLVTVLVTILASSQIVIARTTNPVGDYSNGSLLPTGKFITPLAPPGAVIEPLKTGLRSDDNADAAEAVKTILSPDGKTLLVLTSGYNLNFKKEDGTNITFPVLDPVTGQPTATTTRKHEWVFVFDVSGGTPVKKQQINIPNTYNGLVWVPDGKRFFASGGIDDRVYAYRLDGGQYVPDAPFILLGHNSDQTAPFPKYDGGLLKDTPAGKLFPALATGAVVAGLDVSKDGKTLVAANFMNDSISVIDTASRKVLKEIKFFEAGGTVPTGEYPFDVAVKSSNAGAAVTAYVTSQRDDEVLAVDLGTGTRTRIKVGSQPNKVLLTPNQQFLYVANGNSDTVSVINTLNNQVVGTISLARPGEKYKGSIPNSLALSPDGQKLYVTLGNENAVAVVSLLTQRVEGRIPTGYLPNSVSVSPDGKQLYVVNAKDNIGPNPSNNRTTEAGIARNPTFKNEYTWALKKASVAVIPTPDAVTLSDLSRRVDFNNGYQNRFKPSPLMNYLQGRIKNVIYVVKENRTYDQVLGDLEIGNGDPALTLFPEAVSPNHHKWARDFVTLDNFYDSGESSGVGWNWSTYANTTDFTEKTQSVLYGNAGFNGLTYDYEGPNRNINMVLPQTTATSPDQFNVRPTGLLDPTGQSSILPGDKDANAPAGDGNLNPDAVGGYLWDSALRAGKTVRNYGFYVDGAYYGTEQVDPTQPDPANPYYLPVTRTPFADGIRQAPPAKTALLDKTDVYFRGYDQKNADIYLYEEWLRDMQENGIPNLSLVRLPHDHFGDFSQAVAGLNTADLQMADNDYATAKLVETVSKMPEWKETAIVIIEDDCQNGPDHVDGHRSIAYILSPYTKRKALVSTNYNTVNILRTIEDLLGIEYLGVNDANAQPMADVFTREPDYATYQAVIPGNLCQAPVDPNLVPECKTASVPRTSAIALKHDINWWAAATKGFFFGVEDKVDPEAFNRVLWSGIKGDDVSYPTERKGLNLRQNRGQLLAKSDLHNRQSAGLPLDSGLSHYIQSASEGI